MKENGFKILIFQRILTHYREGIFRELYQKIGALICYGKNGPPGTYLTKAKPDFPHCEIFDFYPYPKKDTLVIQNIFFPLFRYKPRIIIMELAVANLSNWLLFLFRIFFHYKLIVWTHGYNRKFGLDPEKYLRDKLRIWFMNQSDAVIIYSKNNKKVVAPYIKCQDKLFVAQNTLDTRILTSIRDELDKLGKERIKKEVGFEKKYNLIFIGRVLQEKEPDRLIQVFRLIADKVDSIQLHIVGDGPLLDHIKKMASGLEVKFWGNITDDYEAGRLLFVSDLMVMPGYLGLSIMHAFAFDKPVVSQVKGKNGPFHSPEIEYVISGKTGFLTPYGDNKKMAEVIINYLNDARLQETMKNEIRKMLKSCSIEKMIEGFKEAINYVNKGLANDS